MPTDPWVTMPKTLGMVWGRGDVTDYRERTFTGITALQYTMWALDQQMFI